jgi:hypothetical protein
MRLKGKKQISLKTPVPIQNVDNRCVQRNFLCYFLLGQKVTKKATTRTNFRMDFHTSSAVAIHPEVRTTRGLPRASGESSNT